ncbi:MAG: hypothetical protein GTO02_10895, partial [Candidatus Dadabacteria bacterium]|nr:hypothetical protein [Candidatus Dadabacteria bacterium]NIQ14870.1 hypothetical protein [Candidatus Dadabacteria bacterium]
RVLLGIAIFIIFYERELNPYLIDLFDANYLEFFYNKVILSDVYYVVLGVLLFVFIAGFKCRLTGIVLSLMLFPLIFMETMHVSRQLILFSLFSVSLFPSASHINLFKLNNEHIVSAPIWPIRLIQIHLSFLYLTNAISKTTIGYLSGDVLQYMSEILSNFLVDLSSGYLNIYNLSIPVFIFAIGTVVTEYFLAFGFWFRKTRKIAIVVGLLFHFSLKFVVKIAFLGFATVFLYLVFIIPFERNN